MTDIAEMTQTQPNAQTNTAAETDTRSEHVDAALDAFHAVMGALHSASESVLIEVDLTMAQLKTLVTLEKNGAITIGQIADVQRISLPTASHLVERLVQAGLAERGEDPTDRRRTLARLSPAGAAIMERLRQGGQEQFRELAGELDEEDLAALLQGLRALERAAALSK